MNAFVAQVFKITFQSMYVYVQVHVYVQVRG